MQSNKKRYHIDFPEKKKLLIATGSSKLDVHGWLLYINLVVVSLQLLLDSEPQPKKACVLLIIVVKIITEILSYLSLNL